MTLMSNSVSAIVTPPHQKELPDFVKRACEQYAQTRNQQRGGSGRLFAVGFPATTLSSEGALRDTTLHADAAALRSGQLLDPFIHEWSTAPLHAGLPGRHRMRAIWTPSTWYARLGSTASARAVAYRAAMIDFIVFGGDAAIDGERETADRRTYRRRIERPNRSWAREGQSRYGQKKLLGRDVGG